MPHKLRCTIICLDPILILGFILPGPLKMLFSIFKVVMFSAGFLIRVNLFTHDTIFRSCTLLQLVPSLNAMVAPPVSSVT